jgi:FkbM family methyltransferase
MGHGTNPLAQWLAAAEWQDGEGAALRLRRGLRRRISTRWNPTVDYPWYGGVLRLPLAHALPFYRRVHPTYDTPLFDVVRALSAAGEVDVVDVGANIGDSAQMVLAAGARSVLCVEGSPEYLRHLTANVGGDARVHVEPSFVGEDRAEVAERVGKGTGSLTARPGSGVRTRTFGDVLAEHPGFTSARLLKVDTDGWDLPVLRSAVEWLRTSRPVLFFEHDEVLHRRQGYDLAQVWPLLTSCGYTRFLAFTNTGHRLSEGPVTSDVPPVVRQSEPYADVLAVTDEDRWLLRALSG